MYEIFHLLLELIKQNEAMECGYEDLKVEIIVSPHHKLISSCWMY